jgi:hypothetical protein
MAQKETPKRDENSDKQENGANVSMMYFFSIKNGTRVFDVIRLTPSTHGHTVTDPRDGRGKL